ncbi:thioredoxin domain-containing protein [Gimesia maris]|uniref:RedB protein n=1 Tax=Gimesia maris TaxID=122 RepID=A0ABX5YFS4_9PLAN|nr:hypothetical protein [Gimesia maris]EDL56930.1 hypothetical protein PM8797T_07427 [Gimesia maris DSM 8797]QDT76942.1 hypothetical protein Mal35_03660 [Gimesia maris]QEG14520.1 hypothetical protein GmarT_03550 [Gimesia maris]QGQ32061.1 hypothetical protein F1729_27385 [Gimesia maris]
MNFSSNLAPPRQHAGSPFSISEKKKPWSLWFSALTLLWLVAVVYGMSTLWQYQSTPGQTALTASDWPSESERTFNSMRPTLVMFAHPRCPCTAASLSELAKIMSLGPERVDARILFFKSSAFPEGWEKTNLWKTASAIPGVTLISDLDGTTASLFHATTSGYTLLYDTQGKLLFHGGITGSRGHAGDNVGRSAIESILLQGSTGQDETFTFGCPLLGERNDDRQGGL